MRTKYFTEDMRGDAELTQGLQVTNTALILSLS